MTFRRGMQHDGGPCIWYACGVADEIWRHCGLHLIVTSMGKAYADFDIEDIPLALLHSINRQLTAVLSPIGFSMLLGHREIHIIAPDGEPWRQEGT